MNTISIIALILIGLGGIGAILLTIGQSISSNEDKNEIIDTTKSKNLELKEQLTEIKGERDSLGKTLALRDASIHKQNKIIIDLNQKLAQKSEYIQNYITGGESYLFLDMRKLSGSSQYNSFMFQLENHFDLPIYNIDCDVFDYDAISNKSYAKKDEKQRSIKLNDYKTARILNVKFSEMAANSYKTIDQIFPVKNCRYYAIIKARNRTVIAKMTTLIIGKGDYFGFQITDSNGKILLEDINKEMPKEISDKIKLRLNSIPSNLSLTLNEN